MAPRKPQPGRDLASLRPDLAKQAYGWNASTVTTGSDERVEWICYLGHVWRATVGHRSRGSGCPYCAGQQVLAGYNDLATLNPALAKEAVGWDPSTVTEWSNKKVAWRCKKGHDWSVAVCDRSSGRGCPCCAGQRVNPGLSDLATTNPNLAAQAFGWDPSTEMAGSNHKREWICEHGHVWKSAIYVRSSGRGCPICSGNQVLAGFNDLATTNPDLAAQAHGWDPTTVTAGSSFRKFEWRCEKGHVWSVAVCDRSSGRGCPYCANKKLLVGFNDMATTHPEIAAEAHGWNATAYIAGSNLKFEWQCELGHIWNAVMKSRTRGSSCPYCTGKKVLVGFNDLVTTHSEIAAEAHGWNPTVVSRGSDSKHKWRCPKGHVYLCTASNRVAGTGCPSCAETGFNPSKPGCLYLIESVERDMLQIGITNDLKRRLKEHARGHFDLVIEVTPYRIGQLAKNWESRILKHLRAHGAIIARDAGIEKFDGYKESWLRASFPVTSLKELRALVLDEEAAA